MHWSRKKDSAFLTTMNNPHLEELARLRDGKIYVAGHRGMVGSAILRRLEKAGCENLVVSTRKDLDLTDSQQVHDFFSTEKPDYVFLAAAKSAALMQTTAIQPSLSMTT